MRDWKATNVERKKGEDGRVLTQLTFLCVYVLLHTHTLSLALTSLSPRPPSFDQQRKMSAPPRPGKIGAKPWLKGQVDDLASLANLDDAILLEELRTRYSDNKIYVSEALDFAGDKRRNRRRRKNEDEENKPQRTPLVSLSLLSLSFTLLTTRCISITPFLSLLLTPVAIF